MTNDHTERLHAPLSGSTAHRWPECFGSVALCKTVPPQEAGEAAKWGTFVHEIAERALKNFLNYKITGEYADPDWAKYYDDEDAVALAQSYVDCIWKDVLQQSLTGKAWGIEEEVCLDEHLGMWGIVDFWCIYIDDRGKKVLTVVDLKTGYHFVEVKKNPQFVFYGCSMIEEIKKKGKELDVLCTCVFQPRISHGSPFRETSYTNKQVFNWRKKFFKAANAILKGSTKLKVGSWCTFCPAQGVCKAYIKSLSDESSLALLDPEKITFPVPETIPDDKLTLLLTHQDAIEDFLKAVKLYAIARAKNGKAIPGFKVINGPTRRTWIEDEKAVAACLEANGLENPFVKKLVTISVAEKAVGKDALRNIVTTTKPSIILVSDTDPRPSIASAVELLT